MYVRTLYNSSAIIYISRMPDVYCILPVPPILSLGGSTLEYPAVSHEKKCYYYIVIKVRFGGAT
jgi:hypothetical protein